MSAHILAEAYEHPERFTTGDAARALHVTREGVRYLVREGQLACTRTPSKLRLFREEDVDRLARLRSRARLRGVAVLRPKKIGPRGEPRQMSLFRPHLRLVSGRDRSLEQGQVDHARSGGKRSGSDKRRLVTLRGRR